MMPVTEKQWNDRSGLAAALFHLLDPSVPCRRGDEEKAAELFASLETDRKRLLKILSLCEEPSTPKELYLAAKAGSWLGNSHAEETVRYASAYLETPGWIELPYHMVSENGILVSQGDRCRAQVFEELAQAQEHLHRYEAALSNFAEAYRLEPYNAMNAIKMADVVVKSRSRLEALNFLNQQKFSRYYQPVEYTDAQGMRHRNDTFRQVLDSHILKIRSAEQADTERQRMENLKKFRTKHPEGEDDLPEKQK